MILYIHLSFPFLYYQKNITNFIKYIWIDLLYLLSLFYNISNLINNFFYYLKFLGVFFLDN